MTILKSFYGHMDTFIRAMITSLARPESLPILADTIRDEDLRTVPLIRTYYSKSDVRSLNVGYSGLMNSKNSS